MKVLVSGTPLVKYQTLPIPPPPPIDGWRRHWSQSFWCDLARGANPTNIYMRCSLMTMTLTKLVNKFPQGKICGSSIGVSLRSFYKSSFPLILQPFQYHGSGARTYVFLIRSGALMVIKSLGEGQSQPMWPLPRPLLIWFIIFCGFYCREMSHRKHRCRYGPEVHLASNFCLRV